MRSVYLAGPITGLSYGETTNWRDCVVKILRRFAIEGICPMRGKSYLQNEKHIADSYTGVDKRLSSGHAIYKRDKWDAQRCDVMLVNLLGAQKVSIGTMIELGWADSLDIPVVVVMEENNIHTHCFVSEIAYVVVPTLEEGIAVIQTLLGEN